MQRDNSFRALARFAGVLVLVVSAVATIGLVVSAALSVLIARRLVTPPGRAASDLRILAVGESTIVLSSGVQSLAPGRYSLWFADGSGHAQIGNVISSGNRWVTRELIQITRGVPKAGDNARTSGWFYLTPRDLGLAYSDVVIETELGPAPAWLVPTARPTTTWAIHVHGRGVQKPETVRALQEFHDAGITSLAISYRNDTEAPNSADQRYGLGSTEYRDVEAALDYARTHGAERIVLMGWSMGGATVLQTLMRTEHRDQIVGLVLDSPVVAWGPTLELHGDLNRIPTPIQLAARIVLESEQSAFLIGTQRPLDLASMNFIDRAAELDCPILLLHSSGDAYVPVEPSRALAELRPDIVTYEEFEIAGHTRLWNYDSERWLGAIRGWLSEQLTSPLSAAASSDSDRGGALPTL